MLLLNGHKIIPTIFPDKTSQVWKIPEYWFYPDFNEITWIFEDEGEFMHLAQLRCLAGNKGKYVTLRMPYLPYARQDKDVSNDSTFALLVFIKLINDVDFEQVRVFDPHSYVSSGIKNLGIEYPNFRIEEVAELVKPDVVAFPDEGAAIRYGGILKMPVVYGEKIRDQETGEIKQMVLRGDPSDRDVLIVDDICDGGATFVRLAHLLKEAGAKNIHLYISHGIFSKGTQVLRDAGIQRIFTKDKEIV